MDSPKINSYRPLEGSSPQTLSFSYTREGSPRAASMARLAQSPIPSGSGKATPTTSQPQTTPLLHDFAKLPLNAAGTYGSIGTQESALSAHNWNPQEEDPEIIRKHLVSGFERPSVSGSQTPDVVPESSAVVEDDPFTDQFNSLQLQGGDITRPIYRFAEQSTRRDSSHQRSHSFSYPPNRDVEGESIQDIMVPGGFRRNFIQRQRPQASDGEEGPPTFVTRNFLHFLTLYGHFAGEDLEEWDDHVVSGILRKKVC
jgi:hypothetical protein